MDNRRTLREVNKNEKTIFALFLLLSMFSTLLTPSLLVSASNDDWKVAAEFTYYPLAENGYVKINIGSLDIDTKERHK